MDEWSEKIKGIVTQHRKRTTDIDNILKTLINKENLAVTCEVGLANKNELIWNIRIGTRTFTLTNQEISTGQNVEYQDESGFCKISNDKKKDLKEVIKELILKKIE